MNRRRLHRSFFRLFASFCTLSLFCSFYVFYGNIRIANDLTEVNNYDNTDRNRHRRHAKHFPRESFEENGPLLWGNVRDTPKDKRRALQEFLELKTAGKDIKVTQKTQGNFGCPEIRNTKIFDEVGHGYTKFVQKGLIDGQYVAVKSVVDRSKDFQHCLTNGHNYTRAHCFNLVKYKLAKEIILLQQLKHQNIIKVNTILYYF